MAMAFHEITKIQARKKTVPERRRAGEVEARDVRPVEGGRLEDRQDDQQGQGHHGRHPENGGERRPEPDPEVAGDEQPDQPDEGDDEHAHGDGRAQRCRAARSCGRGARGRARRCSPAASSMLIGRHREPAEPVAPARDAADVLRRRMPERFEAVVGVGGHAAGPVRQQCGQLAHAQADDQADDHHQRDGRNGGRTHGRDGERNDAGHQDGAGQADHERTPPVRPSAQGGRDLAVALVTVPCSLMCSSPRAARRSVWSLLVGGRSVRSQGSEGLQVAVELPGRDLGVGGPHLVPLDRRRSSRRSRRRASCRARRAGHVVALEVVQGVPQRHGHGAQPELGRLELATGQEVEVAGIAGVEACGRCRRARPRSARSGPGTGWPSRRCSGPRPGPARAPAACGCGRCRRRWRRPATRPRPSWGRGAASRLYELTVGQATAASASACSSRPPMKEYPSARHPEARARRPGRRRARRRRSLPQAQVHVQPVPGQVGERLGHEGGQHPASAARVWTM